MGASLPEHRPARGTGATDMAGTPARPDLSWSTFAAFVLLWPSCCDAGGVRWRAPLSARAIIPRCGIDLIADALLAPHFRDSSAGHFDQGAISGHEQPNNRSEREGGECGQRIPPP